MKKFLFVILLLAAGAGLFYFGQSALKSSPTIKGVKADTSLTTILYAFNLNQNNYSTSTATRIINHKDTIYWVPVFFNKPDTVNGKPVLDSLKQPKIKSSVEWKLLPKKLLLVDYNKKW